MYVTSIHRYVVKYNNNKTCPYFILNKNFHLEYINSYIPTLTYCVMYLCKHRYTHMTSLAQVRAVDNLYAGGHFVLQRVSRSKL